MNDLTEKLTRSYKPVLAVIVYSPGDNWQDCYLESHQIGDDGKLLEGKPLKQETIQGIVDVFFDEKKNRQTLSGMIPSNLICFDHLPGGNYRIMWHRPAERRVLHFADSLHLPTGEAWVPAMLYVVEGKALRVFALADDERPKEDTPLYMAPYHNVAADGDVCLGSAKVKKPTKATYEGIIKYWEDMFWLSKFTHIAGSHSPVKGNVNLCWKQLIENPMLNWHQLDELLPSEVTMKKLFKW